MGDEAEIGFEDRRDERPIPIRVSAARVLGSDVSVFQIPDGFDAPSPEDVVVEFDAGGGLASRD